MSVSPTGESVNAAAACYRQVSLTAVLVVALLIVTDVLVTTQTPTYPFLRGWHELTSCYRAAGWEMTAKKKGRGSLFV